MAKTLPIPPPPPPPRFKSGGLPRIPPPPTPPPPPVVKPTIPSAPKPKVRSLGYATPHVRRVTLNMIRYAACCPDDLRPVLDRLADVDWKMNRLTEAELETIYAHVDGDLGDKAKAEFVADTSTIFDHRASDATCLLCGQQHIRWEFTLRNTKGGRDHNTGSSCIIQYGLNVDGAATADEALALLNGAINRLKKVATRDAWQEEHPDHVERIDELKTIAALLQANKWLDYNIARQMGTYTGSWRRAVEKWLSSAKKVLDYYRKNEYLTDIKTRSLYADHDDALVPSGRRRVAKLQAAAAQVKATNPDAKGLRKAGSKEHATKKWDRKAKEEFWAQFIADYPLEDMTAYQRNKVDRWQRINLSPALLDDSENALLDEIRTGKRKPAPEPASGPSVDNSDLPF